MKISHIVLFILCVLLGLTLICLLMPADGIKIGNVTLEFPTLAEVLGEGSVKGGDAKADTLTPEQLMQQRMSALQSEKLDGFRTFSKNNPARIYLPKNDETYLDPFFSALLDAGKKHLRILHYGDSQLECDRISSDLRERFQEEFGGSGNGLIPAEQTIATYTMCQTTTGTYQHYMLYGSADFRASHSRYGVMAQVDHVGYGTVVNCVPRDLHKYPHIAPVTLVKVMAQGGGSISLVSDSGRVEMEAETCNANLTYYTVRLKYPSKRIQIRFDGEFDVYGIMLDDTHGVSLDNVPMRGCSGNIFNRIDKSTFAPFFQKENVPLIILQYGGNSVPFYTTPHAISTYVSTLRKQIRLFHTIAPKARILFVGPGDMATNIRGSLQTYPSMEMMVDSLRQMSLSEGVAFWDMFAAMGGRGSIVKWNKARPQLAGDDYIHFTPKGAKKISDIFYETLRFYYRFYRMRTGKDNAAIKAELDSLMQDSVQRAKQAKRAKVKINKK